MVAMLATVLSGLKVTVARWLWLAVLASGREARQRPLFHVAAAWARSPTFSGRTTYFDLPWDLGYKFERSVFGVVFLSHGGFPLS